MRASAALFSPRRRAMTLFVGAELVLAMAVPFLAIAGYHELLDSRAGHFVSEPTEGEPGWRALVEPSPLVAVVEMERGGITGVALLAASVDSDVGGTVILVPGTLSVGGTALDERAPDEAVTALAEALRLGVSTTIVVGEDRWGSVLGDRVYEVANPDPVTDDDGSVLLAVGPAPVGADNAALFMGRPVAGSDEITLLFRRRILWSALIADPPDTDDPLVDILDVVSGPAARVADLPLSVVTPAPELDVDGAEALIRDVVPVPTGAVPGDRVRVRVIDRSGQADLAAVAAEVAAAGVEVVEIGNAAEFDDGSTELIVPADVDAPEISDLAILTGATTVQSNEVEPDSDGDQVVTLVIGADFVTRSQ